MPQNAHTFKNQSIGLWVFSARQTTLRMKSVVLDGAMRHKMRVQSTPTLIIANQTPSRLWNGVVCDFGPLPVA